MASFNRSLLVKKIYDSGILLFNTQTLGDLLGVQKENTLFVIVRSLLKIGVLEKIEKGKFYLASRPPDDFSLAYFLYQPSYISLETALNLYGVLSQFPYEVTSVTTKKKREKIVRGKPFVFLHIAPHLFWGYIKKNDSLVAKAEKAVLDTLYFASRGERGFNFEELDFSRIDKEKLLFYAAKFPNTRQFAAFLKRIKKYL